MPASAGRSRCQRMAKRPCSSFSSVTQRPFREIFGFLDRLVIAIFGGENARDRANLPPKRSRRLSFFDERSLCRHGESDRAVERRPVSAGASRRPPFRLESSIFSEAQL